MKYTHLPSGLTTAQLKKLWEPKSKVKSLSELGGGLPSGNVDLFGPGTDSGTFDFFVDDPQSLTGLKEVKAPVVTMDRLNELMQAILKAPADLLG